MTLDDDDDRDDLDELIKEATKKDPGFPKLLKEAQERLKKEREKKSR
jgi:hypothetical protein